MPPPSPLTDAKSASSQSIAARYWSLPSCRRSGKIFRSLTVEENLTVAGRQGRWTLPRVYDFFPSLGARRRNRGDQLSGGEQQMLAIGRALMGDPIFLLMDEPLEGLAPVIVDLVLAALERLKREEGLALVLVEQHAHLALEFAENAIVLERGAIVHRSPEPEAGRRPRIDVEASRRQSRITLSAASRKREAA